MLWWLIQNTVLAALLALGVALVGWLARPRPALRHALWLIVLCKLVTPPCVYWPWAVPAFGWIKDESAIAVPAPAASVLVWTLTPRPLDVAPRTIQDPPLVVADDSASPPDSDPAESCAAAADAVWWQGISADRVVIALWASGASLMLLMQVAGAMRFRRGLGRVEQAPAALLREVGVLARRMGIHPPHVRVAEHLSSPLVWSLGRSVLLWPSELVDRLSAASRRGVLVHELAHLRRRDHWVDRLLLVAGWVWWWNPLYWLVRRELHRSAELACDAWVVGTLPRDRRPYAEALLEVIERVSRTTVPLPGLGMGASRRDFERRLTMIMRESAPCRVPAWGLPLLGLMAVLAAPVWSLAQQEKRTTTDLNVPGDGKNYPVLLDPVGANQQDLINLNQAGIVYFLDDVAQKGNTAQGWITLFDAVDDPKAEADRDKRLEKLEQQLQAMLKEVQTLRGKSKEAKPAPKQAANQPAVDFGSVNRQWTLQPHVNDAVWFTNTLPPNTVLWGNVQQPHNYTWATSVKQHEAVPGVTLSRVTYTLAKDKADVLAWFLRDYVKAQVMETKHDGDKLTVTTTPGVQKDIGRLIASMQGQAQSTAPNANQAPGPKTPENPRAKPQEKPQPKGS